MPELPANFLAEITSSAQIQWQTTAKVTNPVALLILPDQLNLSKFSISLLESSPLLIWIESFAYASFIPHHRQKLTYMLSAQRHFVVECASQGYEVLNIFSQGTYGAAIAQLLGDNPHLQLTYMQPSEWDTRQDLEQVAQTFSSRMQVIPNSFFLADLAQFKGKIAKGYRLETFYRQLRKSTGWLMAGDHPIGGKWNYDQQNRKKLPKGIPIPEIKFYPPDQITQEVIDLVAQLFPDHFGELDNFGYAVTRAQALALATQFVQERLSKFGDYEDAIAQGQPFLFHSVLSLYLNNGLLLPEELCQQAIAAYDQGNAPLNSVEGFVRQILGWREYIRVYYEAMIPHVRQSNHFNFQQNLPQLYWHGQTQLACLASTLGEVIKYGYTHHIQRLMILSNFSNLTFTDPRQLNHWFWLAFVDAYEWVELPNVLGMATFADGGVLASKPYVSGGNYIHKMSDHCRHCYYDVQQKTGEKACPFNYLYWNFVDRFRQDFNENGRVSLMVGMYDKKSPEEKSAIQASATSFLENLPR
ncbi:MAG: cryptochrome/photolyase family protein [Pseudanabaenaceae cyanobacterium bins.68]|nr:cryptochrome/photolyase family protein [Pseudanabaenaceae cyanobacterium bins.68]